MRASNPPALLLFSGGIDSVQALYARCAAGEHTRTHHVRLSNWEGRGAAEASAVRASLAWLQKRFPGLIRHTESAFDYGDLRFIVRDHNVWGLFTGIILADPKNAHITEVVRTFHRDSVRGGLASPAGQAAERAWGEPVARLTRGRDIQFVYPQIDMTKGEIMAAMPAELLKLAWYCRRPRRGSVCHECHTCRQVDAVLAGSPLPPLSSAVEAPKGNASRQAWAEYARQIGAEFAEDASRDEIKAAVDGR